VKDLESRTDELTVGKSTRHYWTLTQPTGTVEGADVGTKIDDARKKFVQDYLDPQIRDKSKATRCRLNLMLASLLSSDKFKERLVLRTVEWNYTPLSSANSSKIVTSAWEVSWDSNIFVIFRLALKLKLRMEAAGGNYDMIWLTLGSAVKGPDGEDSDDVVLLPVLPRVKWRAAKDEETSEWSVIYPAKVFPLARAV
jgi:hypothetical protein